MVCKRFYPFRQLAFIFSIHKHIAIFIIDTGKGSAADALNRLNAAAVLLIDEPAPCVIVTGQSDEMIRRYVCCVSARILCRSSAAALAFHHMAGQDDFHGKVMASFNSVNQDFCSHTSHFS